MLVINNDLKYEIDPSFRHGFSNLYYIAISCKTYNLERLPGVKRHLSYTSVFTNKTLSLLCVTSFTNIFKIKTNNLFLPSVSVHAIAT